MAATGFTPIKLYASSTASAVPLAANLDNTNGAELAINTNDGKLFYKDSAGVVQTMASKATGAIGGSTTQVQFNNAGVLGGSASLTWSGTVLTSSGFSGPLNGTVGATTPAAGSFTTVGASGAVTLSGGTANGVTYLDGSKVLTSGSALTFDGSTLKVATATAGDLFVVESIDDSSGAAPDFVLYRNSASPAASDQIGNILWRGKDSGGADQSYARILTVIGSPTAGAETASLWIGTQSSDGLQNRYVIDENRNHIWSGSSELMRLTSTGLGIGTNSPTSGLQTAGSSSKSAFKTPNIAEVNTVSATAASGTIQYDITTQSVLYYTSNASANWTVNFRGSSGTSLNTVMQTGESISVTFLATQGATAYYNSAVTIDGNSVTPKWQGGSAPTSGNASSIDSYNYVIIKVGSGSFTVLASVTKFA